MKVAALIPAKKHSTGVPGKNTEKVFCGKLLWQWTYETAHDSGVFDKIILSTDNEDYAKYENYADDLIVDWKRPDELCRQAPNDSVLLYYVNQYPEVETWSLLQLTSPLRTAQDIKDAYAMMLEKDTRDDYRYDSLVSVFPDPMLGWIANSVGIPGVENPQAVATYRINKRPNRQDRKDWYKENGAIYFTRKYVIEHAKCRLHGFIGLYVMPKERSIEIDDITDWETAEFLMKKVS